MVNVELIGKKKPISYNIILYIWSISSILFFSSFLFHNLRIVRFSGLIFSMSFIIWIIGNLLIKSYLVVGYVEFSYDLIKVKNDIEILDFDVLKLKDMVLQYNGANGDSYGYVGSMRINDGSHNIISFVHDGVNYEYRFLVKNRHFLNIISKYIKIWKENGSDIKVMRNKKDITYKLIRGRQIPR
jgi:hypothetical protein